MAVIGCDIPVRVSGAEDIGAKMGIWVKTHFREEGSYLIATTYLVADGSPTVFELRVDLRALEKVATVIHKALHDKLAASGASPAIGFSFSKAWRSIKKTAKKIGRSKLVKAVTGTVGSVVKNKVFQIAMPMAAVAAHTASKAAGGKGVVTGPLGHVLDMGTSAALAVVPGGAAAAATPKALAAFGGAQAAIKAATTGRQLLSTATQAKNILAKGNAIAQRAVVFKKEGTPAALAMVAKAKASPAVVKALAVKARLADPKVKAQLLAIKARADSAQKALAKVNFDSKNASGAKKTDAQKSRAIVNLVAQNQLKLKAIAQKHAGGLPALLIDNKGKITRGKFAVKASPSKAASNQLLYLGPGNTERGLFTKIGDGVSRIANDIIGASIPPTRPRTRTRGQVIDQWLAAQQKKGKLGARVAGCYSIPNGGGQRLRVSGTAPGLIGCDCGRDF